MTRAVVALLAAAALAACHGAPIAERPSPPAPTGEQSAPPAPAVDVGAISADTPILTPIIAPPCLPVETPAKPRPKAAPKETAVAPPPSGSARAAAAGTEVGVRPLDVSVASVLGKKVQGAKGEDLGRVVDVLADSTGRVRAAVIEFGGFLGVGNRRIAVDWSLLKFTPDGQADFLISTVGANRFQSVPEYKNAARPQALMAPQAPAAASPSGAADDKK